MSKHIKLYPLPGADASLRQWEEIFFFNTHIFFMSAKKLCKFFYLGALFFSLLRLWWTWYRICLHKWLKWCIFNWLLRWNLSHCFRSICVACKHLCENAIIKITLSHWKKRSKSLISLNGSNVYSFCISQNPP